MGGCSRRTLQLKKTMAQGRLAARSCTYICELKHDNKDEQSEAAGYHKVHHQDDRLDRSLPHTLVAKHNVSAWVVVQGDRRLAGHRGQPVLCGACRCMAVLHWAILLVCCLHAISSYAASRAAHVGAPPRRGRPAWEQRAAGVFRRCRLLLHSTSDAWLLPGTARLAQPHGNTVQADTQG